MFLNLGREGGNSGVINTPSANCFLPHPPALPDPSLQEQTGFNFSSKGKIPTKHHHVPEYPVPWRNDKERQGMKLGRHRQC